MQRTRSLLRAGGLALVWLAAVAATFVVAWAVARSVTGVLGADAGPVDAGLIATFAGVVAGVPVALLLAWLTRREARRSEAASERSRRHRLLRVLERDLRTTLDEIRGRDRTQATVPFVRHDVWDAVAASGQLALIDDVELLEVVAHAYYVIRITAEFERDLWRAIHDPAHFTRRVDATTGDDVTNRLRVSLLEAVRDQDEGTIEGIELALDRLRLALSAVPS